jgi:diaminohydroxyphosphoribosylaminopyrimidine deaminase/5-amino-6-(5-phosphoribosylamino)uracil reductase
MWFSITDYATASTKKHLQTGTLGVKGDDMNEDSKTVADKRYMIRALRLARKGEGLVSPNPMVGSVIVKEDRIIGEGYHRCYGEAHAERNAIASAKESIKGSTFYVTLEPCTHHGRTPPCVDAVIAAQPARVVIGTADPNPMVAGKGIAALKKQGIQTTVGVLTEECRELNERFFKFMETGIPFVTLKYAQSIDGRIATVTGHSRWISSPASLKFAHRLRSIHDGIMVGIGTVLADNPDLTVREVKGRSPTRIIVDQYLKIPLEAAVLGNQDKAKTIIATTANADPQKAAGLRQMGIELLTVEADENGRVDLQKVLAKLGKRGMTSVMIEGGAALITQVLRHRMADRLVVIIAPKIIGRGIEAVGDLEVARIDDAYRLTYRKIIRKDGDMIIDGRILEPGNIAAKPI